MAYAFVEDIAAAWEHYERFAAALEGPVPEGLVFHAAGPTEEGFRIIGVWETEEAWERFRADRLDPDAEAVAQVPPTFRALRPRHIVQRGAGPTDAPTGLADTSTHEREVRQ